MRLDYAALSDLGRVRKDNQDAGYAGPHLLVIADGVGGSARGDIASRTAVDQLRRLDRPPGDAEEAGTGPDSRPQGGSLEALAGAIHRTHDRIAELVEEQPEIDGTSTTVTAAIFDGTRLGVAHVGDSRAYLLRAGTLAQLTTDHTFVQSLIDEGRITEAEARVHPHRNLILRAVDGVHEPEPDVFSVDLALGDRLLLCSDGCSGVLEDDALGALLGDGTPDLAALALVNAALDAGSSDNVTVVVAEVAAEHAGSGQESETSAASVTGPMVVGSAAELPRRRGLARLTGEIPRVRTDARGGDRAAGAGGSEDDPEALRYAPRAPRRFSAVRGVLAAALGLALLAGVGYAAYRWTQGQYYVGADDGQVAIYRGVEADIPGVRLHRVAESSAVPLADLPDYNARQVREGIAAADLEDARGIVTRLVRLQACTAAADPSPGASAAPTTPAAGATPSARAATPATPASPTGSPTAGPTPDPCVETP